MTIKTIAPYGEWKSPITIENTTAESKAVTSPRSDLRTGRSFFLEATPEGSSTLVEVTTTANGALATHRVLPDPHRIGTAVYEYGGGAYEVLPAAIDGDKTQLQRIIFSDAADGNAVKLLVLGGAEPVVRLLVGGRPELRFADFGPSPAGGEWVLAVQEDHTRPEPENVVNSVVAINVDTGLVRVVVCGADFYTTPRWSPDGKTITWRWWDHPEMAWTRSQLCWAGVERVSSDEGPVLKDSTLVAGGRAGEGIGEFAWGLDGALYFTQETDEGDWRQMFKVRPGEEVEKLRLKGLEDVEIGNCSMGLDTRTFAFLSDTVMVLTYDKFATHFTVHVDLRTLKITPLDVPLIDLRDAIAAITPTSFLMIGAGAKQPQGAYHFSLTPSTLKTTLTPLQLTSTTLSHIPPTLFSTPQHIQLISKQSPYRTIHGFYWPPHNPSYLPTPNTLPPLIVNPHGGPTAESGAGLTLGGVAGGNIPLYTSRGFAYLALNYTGSTGHGRAYRTRLDGQWGVLDRDDVPEAVAYLCASGRADSARVGIHGGSAGGYNVLQSLVWHPDVFAAGVCYCGVSDVAALARGTHKLESHYLEGLLYEPGLSVGEREEVERERSPLWHAGRIEAPLLLLHGDQDTVVPIGQSFEIEKRVRERGGVVKMVVAQGDGHQFKMRASQRLAVGEDLEWFLRYLVRK